MKIIYPYKVYAEYEDGHSGYCCGFSEEEAMEAVGNAQEKHGALTYITIIEQEEL